MGRVKSAAELQALAEKAKAREAARVQRKISSTRTPQRAEDTTLVYYRDPLIAGRFLGIRVANSNLLRLGGDTLSTGVTRAGLLTDLPEGTSLSNVIIVAKGTKIAHFRLNWYAGDSAPVLEKTPWNTTWTRYYDRNGTRSHYSVPFSIATGAFTVNTIITKFLEYFDSDQQNNLRTLIGTLGRADLVVQRGSQKVTIMSVT